MGYGFSNSSATNEPPIVWWIISAMALVLLVRDRYTISTFFASFSDRCCARETPYRRPMVTRTITDKTAARLIALRTSAPPSLWYSRSIAALPVTLAEPPPLRAQARLPANVALGPESLTTRHSAL